MSWKIIGWCGCIADPYGYPVQGNRHFDTSISLNDLRLVANTAQIFGVNAQIFGHTDVCPEGEHVSLYQPNKQTLLSHLRRVSEQSTPTDQLLFVSTNHGTQSGLLTSDPVDPFEADRDALFITPADLSSALSTFKGLQLLLIVCCHAGTFLSIATERRTVIACCGRNETYHISPSEQPHSPILRELLGRLAGAKLEGFSDLPRCDLSTAIPLAFQNSLHPKFTPAFLPNPIPSNCTQFTPP